MRNPKNMRPALSGMRRNQSLLLSVPGRGGEEFSPESDGAFRRSCVLALYVAVFFQEASVEKLSEKGNSYSLLPVRCHCGYFDPMGGKNHQNNHAVK